MENIGARRLHTVLERVFEDLSFTAPDRGGDRVTVDAAFVETYLGELSRSADLSRYVLEASGPAPRSSAQPRWTRRPRATEPKGRRPRSEVPLTRRSGERRLLPAPEL